MSVLSHRTEPVSRSILQGEASDIEDTSGWDDEVETSQKIDYKIIQTANESISLYSILNNYDLEFEQIYSTTGWTHRCSCPFLDHRDNKPSFGYNSIEDRFNCFGCNRGGKAVEFVAYMEDKSRINAAKDLIGDSFSLEEISKKDFNNFDYNRLDDLLFGYADFLREFKINNNFNPDAMKYADAVTWNLDVYLLKHVPFSSVDLDNLEVRINKLKEQLDMFKLCEY